MESNGTILAGRNRPLYQMPSDSAMGLAYIAIGYKSGQLEGNMKMKITSKYENGNYQQGKEIMVKLFME